VFEFLSIDESMPFTWEEFNRLKQMSGITDYMRGSRGQTAPARSYSTQTLVDFKLRFQGTELAWQYWETKPDLDKFNYWFVRVQNPRTGEYQELTDAINNGFYQSTHSSGKPIEWDNHPEPDPPTITIHHKKSERIEIREINEGEKRCLEQTGSFRFVVYPRISVYQQIPAEMPVTHFTVTREDILNQTIFESEHT
jgi:hypothetical protein